MIYRYIYKITCTSGKFKGKFYYGQHTTKNFGDGYKGSSKLLAKYYKKHPNDFIKEIISFHNSKEELDKAEYDIIHPWLNHPDCLNLIKGGTGGALSEISRKKQSESLKGRISPMKGKHLSEEHKNKLSEVNKGKILGSCSESRKRKISESLKDRHLSEIHKKHIGESIYKYYQEHDCYWKGKNLSEEHRNKISEANKGRHIIFSKETKKENE